MFTLLSGRIMHLHLKLNLHLKLFIKLCVQLSVSYLLALKKYHLFFKLTLPLVLRLPAFIIFNYSYKYSVLSSDWKCAAVTPLLKKGDPCFVTNY